MITAAERGAGSFSGILPTLDQMIADGRELPDAVLLSAVLLPRIMLRRFEVESRRPEHWMKMPAYLAAGERHPRVLSSSASRWPTTSGPWWRNVLEGFHRLCSQGWTPAAAGALRLEELPSTMPCCCSRSWCSPPATGTRRSSTGKSAQAAAAAATAAPTWRSSAVPGVRAGAAAGDGRGDACVVAGLAWRPRIRPPRSPPKQIDCRPVMSN